MAQRAVIIGAGITGTLVGHALATRGWSVTILEAEHVGAGSSSRTAAGIRQQFSTPETVMGMRYAVDVYRNFPALVGGDDVPIVQSGYLFLLATEDDMAGARALVRLQQACGLGEVELLDAPERRAAIARDALAHVAAHFSWDAVTAQFAASLERFPYRRP